MDIIISSNSCWKIWNSYFPYTNLQEKGLLVLTYNEQYLHCNVTDCRAPGGGQVIIANKANVVRYSHSNIERCQQNKPVPTSFKSAKMQKYEFGLLCIRNFVLRKCWFIYKYILWIKTQRREGRNLELETRITQHWAHFHEEDHLCIRSQCILQMTFRS